MAQASMTVRLDSDKKLMFETLCKDFGMSANTAFTLFVHSVIRNQCIPFTIASSQGLAVKEAGLQTLERIRKQAVESGTAGMSLREINKEINLAREGK